MPIFPIKKLAGTQETVKKQMITFSLLLLHKYIAYCP